MKTIKWTWRSQKILTTDSLASLWLKLIFAAWLNDICMVFVSITYQIITSWLWWSETFWWPQLRLYTVRSKLRPSRPRQSCETPAPQTWTHFRLIENEAANRPSEDPGLGSEMAQLYQDGRDTTLSNNPKRLLRMSTAWSCKVVAGAVREKWRETPWKQNASLMDDATSSSPCTLDMGLSDAPMAYHTYLSHPDLWLITKIIQAGILTLLPLGGSLSVTIKIVWRYITIYCCHSDGKS